MVDITVDEISEASTIGGDGYFDRFMQSTNTYLQDQYSKNRIKSSEYASVYLGAMQSALTEAVKLAIGRQLASAQADLAIANTTKVEVDKDLVRAEITYKEALTDNTITENGLILERITNLEKDTLIKIQEELIKKKDIIFLQSKIDKSAKEIDKLIADIARVNQDTANALSQNAVIVAEAARVIASTLKIEADTLISTKQLEKMNKEILLLSQEILVKSKEVQLMIARISKMSKEELNIVANTALTAQRTALTAKEIDKLVQDILNIEATIKLTKAREDNTICETAKCKVEVELIEARVITETANTDGSVILNGSILAENINLTKQKTTTEAARTDGTVIGAGSLFGKEVEKIDIGNNINISKYDPDGIVVPGSSIDCETRLACAKVETERANYTSVGTGISDIAPDSLLGAKAKLTFAQANTEEANLDPVNVKPDSVYRAKIKKMEADANNALANYNPEEAGVAVNSKLDCETKLACARAESEKANYTSIGLGSEEISPTSLLGARADLLIRQANSEKANVDGSDVTNNSLLHHKIAKMQSDANNALANYDPVGAGVVSNSKLDCETKLTCARVKSEAANYTEIGNGLDQIDPTSLIGARANLLINQSKSELANTDATGISEGSYLDAKIDKMIADSKNSLAQYDPILAGVKEDSKLACEAKLACARAATERAQTQEIGNGVGQLNAESLMGSKAVLAKYQSHTEKANTDASGLGNGSLVKARIDKMIADAEVAHAPLETVGNGTGQLKPGSKLGLETLLTKAQTATEIANTDQDDIDDESLVGARIQYLLAQKDKMDKDVILTAEEILKIKAETGFTLSKYKEAPLSGSLIDCQAKLYCAQAGEHSVKYTLGIDPVTGNSVPLNEQSPMGAEMKLTLARADDLTVRSVNDTIRANATTVSAAADTTRATNDSIRAGNDSIRANNDTLVAGARTVLLGNQASVEVKRESVMEVQKNLYNTQADHYDADTRHKKAKLYVDMYTISASVAKDPATVGIVTEPIVTPVIDLI